MTTLILPMLSNDIPAMAPPGCRPVKAKDLTGESRYFAIVPDGLPIYWDGRGWQLPCPFICQLIEHVVAISDRSKGEESQK
jgi:hypothetical protein